MLIIIFRTIILYIVVIAAMRLMGKKQIGEMEPFELVVAIMISDLAAVPMQDTRISVFRGIIPIITLLFLQTSIALMQLKSHNLRILFSGKPTLLIDKGILKFSELRKEKFNLNDLLEELRLQGYYNISDVEYAVLETSGKLSVIPKTNLSPVTKEDMNVKCSQDTLPITLILDGKINFKSLKIIKKNQNWLKNTLQKNKVNSIQDVLIATLDSKGKFFYQCKNPKN